MRVVERMTLRLTVSRGVCRYMTDGMLLREAMNDHVSIAHSLFEHKT